MTEIKQMTRAQVAEHNTSNSLWICIGNKVYDLTKYLDEANKHPGGSEVLLKLGGHDATEEYEDIGHSTDARQMKENYLVAEIVEEEKMTYSYDKEFEKVDENKRYSISMDSVVFYSVLGMLFACGYMYFLYYLI
uniref:Cytochrome b5 n=1 Tax=Onchocerca volvulus TaxID=6282 RepID=A0A8R1XSH0_ONCVO